MNFKAHNFIGIFKQIKMDKVEIKHPNPSPFFTGPITSVCLLTPQLLLYSSGPTLYLDGARRKEGSGLKTQSLMLFHPALKIISVEKWEDGKAYVLGGKLGENGQKSD